MDHTFSIQRLCKHSELNTTVVFNVVTVFPDISTASVNTLWERALRMQLCIFSCPPINTMYNLKQDNLPTGASLSWRTWLFWVRKISENAPNWWEERGLAELGSRKDAESSKQWQGTLGCHTLCSFCLEWVSCADPFPISGISKTKSPSLLPVTLPMSEQSLAEMFLGAHGVLSLLPPALFLAKT